jgi:hypothetical protein
MSKTNDTLNLDSTPQVRELRDDELEKVSGGDASKNEIAIESVDAFRGRYQLQLNTANSLLSGQH